MSVENIKFLILGILVFEFIFSKTISYFNTLNWSEKLPKELKDIYDQKKYSKSMKYEKAKYKYENIVSIFTFILTLLAIYFWIFGWFYDYLTQYSENIIYITLLFFWIISLFQTIITLPLSYFYTFVIEEKFGFNKMTKKIFFIDTIKWTLLSFVIGWLLLALITWIYLKTWNMFWIYTWWVMIFFSVFMMMFYSSLIVPLFNKQTPLKKWDLRNQIEKFAKNVWFKLDNIFVIDGSKRSTKANAYFSGFWPKKRIVLYDTLIKDLTNNELVAVLAHEIWHYKKKHTLQMFAFGMLQTWFMLFILGIALNYEWVSRAMWAESWSFAVWMIAFGILFTPVSIIFWIFWNILSRKNEYEADEYAWNKYKPEKLKGALIKLSKNNLSNLRPHPVYEFFHYSHPTVLKRIKALDDIKQ